GTADEWRFERRKHRASQLRDQCGYLIADLQAGIAVQPVARQVVGVRDVEGRGRRRIEAYQHTVGGGGRSCRKRTTGPRYFRIERLEASIDGLYRVVNG